MSDVLSQVLEVSPARTTKAEIIDYYRATYGPLGSKNSWKQHLINDLSPIAGIAPKNLEKRFDAGPKGRINNPEPRNAAQYKELGEQIAPRVPDGGYHITGTVYVKFSDGECEEREVDEVIEGKDAAALLAMALDQAEDVAYQAIVNHYMD